MKLENTFSSCRMGLGCAHFTLFMHLREGEEVLKVFRHHPTPFAKQIFIILIGGVPFYFLLYIFRENIPLKVFSIALLSISLLFIFVLTYVSLIYWLDKLVITTQRIVFIDWKSLRLKDEAEAFYHEIQEIQTKEKGVLAYFRVFDYGSIIIETASAHVDIIFPDAPDPEGIRRFIYHIREPK